MVCMHFSATEVINYLVGRAKQRKPNNTSPKYNQAAINIMKLFRRGDNEVQKLLKYLLQF